jgi:hypothetical protein
MNAEGIIYLAIWLAAMGCGVWLICLAWVKFIGKNVPPIVTKIASVVLGIIVILVLMSLFGLLGDSGPGVPQIDID